MMSMKTLRIMILGLLATVTITQAQATDPGWYQVQIPMVTGQTVSCQSHELQIEEVSVSQLNVPANPVAEVITPHIQALADGLQHDPVRIFDYVHDHIKFVLYFGSKKGAELTLQEKSGNDFDQSALLVALLQAAGYTNVTYQFGWQEIPYDDPYGHNYDLHHWWQLTLTNTVWTNTISYVTTLAADRGYPFPYIYYDQYSNDAINGYTNNFLLQRTWVALTVGSTTYQLDPAFKISLPISMQAGFSLTNAMGSSTISNDLLSAAAGTDNTNYTQNLSESAIGNKLTAYTTNLLNYIQNNAATSGVQDILGGWKIVPANNAVDCTNTLAFRVNSINGTMPILSWTYEPTNLMSTLSISFAGTNYFWFMPQLQGQRLALVFGNTGIAQLWQDDTLLLQKAAGGSPSTNVTIAVTHPFGSWNTVNNVFVNNPNNFANQSVAASFRTTNSTYAILYAFEPDWGWLQQRQNKLDAYLQQGLTNGSREVTSETLNVMGLNWMLQTEQAEQMLAPPLAILPQHFHRLGRMAQETGRGYYVDVYIQYNGELPSGGMDVGQNQILTKQFDLSTLFSSALEHCVIEQLQNTNLVAASTVKMLEIANTNAQKVYLANSNNWSSIQSSLINYGSALTQIYNQWITHGYYLLLPANGSNQVSTAPGSWSGYGFEARQVGTTTIAGQMVISGNYYGGYSSNPSIPVNPAYVQTSDNNQPTYYNSTPLTTPAPRLNDPVDAANGTFELQNTDLSLGQAEPRGITLSHYYNGARRFNNPAGMTGGWLHNYSINATALAAPQAGLGGTTPAQAAAMLVAATAANAFYNGGYPNAKNWLTTALIAKWGTDQLTKNGVSISLGKDTLQFVKQPNGSFSPPANCTASLTQSNSFYSLRLRHGNTFNFDSLGYLTNIVDQYSQSMSLTYNASNWVSTVKDWKNRQLTFNYSGTPQRLTSVTDGSRTIGYGYSTAYNAQGDLSSITDAESKVSTYVYDTNHQVIATFDAQNRLVVTNLYDSQGHVTTQYTQGDTNRIWRVFWSGWQTTEVDPAGNKTDYRYDDQNRLIAVIDPLTNETDTIYDGQNHIVATISSLGETNRSVYDSNHNVILTIDPLNHTNQFVYDNQNNLICTIDPLGHSNSFGYNAQFSLVGQTNGAGDWINFGYNSDGTLRTRTDAGGTTTNNYDSYGQLNGIIYPGGLGSESIANNSLGDATNHLDACGAPISYQYNNRRQLTMTIAPSNLTSKVGFDAIGNAANVTDPRGNVTSNSWSATRHLLATIYPAAQQGAPVVTNIYDNRDCLIQTLDPYQQPTSYTNDAKMRVVAVTDPLQRITRIGYDGDGRQIAITNAAQEVTRQTWDANGKMLQLVDGASHVSARVYDAAGNQIVLTNRNGKVWQFQYDSANRLTNTITPLGRSISLAFNHQGLVNWVKDPAGQITTNGYDGKARLTTRTDGVGTTSYGYDLNDNQTNLVENGQTNSWVFDVYNRVTTYRDGAGNLIQYRYDANGNVTNLVYPGGKNVYYAFDNLNRLTNVTDWAQRKTVIGYDLAGRVRSITRPNGSCRTIGYDPAGQATNILEQMSNSLPIAIMMHGWTNSGAMAWEFAAPLPHPVTVPTRTMTYDDDNRLLTINGVAVTNDLNANLTYAPLTNGVLTTQAFDARNRLASSGGVTNVYDAVNSRIGQTQGTNMTAFVVNPNTALPQTLMRIKNGLTNYYIYGAGLLYQITETASATNTLTYHYDYRGSTIALSADNGQVTDRIEYSAYGITSYRKGSSDTPFLFNGRYGVMTDANGLLYMRARYYNPYLCRFISQDPSGFGGGLNLFAYANGNPISHVDPFGLDANTISMNMPGIGSSDYEVTYYGPGGISGVRGKTSGDYARDMAVAGVYGGAATVALMGSAATVGAAVYAAPYVAVAGTTAVLAGQRTLSAAQNVYYNVMSMQPGNILNQMILYHPEAPPVRATVAELIAVSEPYVSQFGYGNAPGPGGPFQNISEARAYGAGWLPGAISDISQTISDRTSARSSSSK